MKTPIGIISSSDGPVHTRPMNSVWLTTSNSDSRRRVAATATLTSACTENPMM